ncbi:MAG: hypothetical protein PHF44_00475 [Candidatus Pacebacteria bacterium]|nr:hypothetical protein [Candidatus Paceibacterota bacterium]
MKKSKPIFFLILILFFAALAAGAYFMYYYKFNPAEPANFTETTEKIFELNGFVSKVDARKYTIVINPIEENAKPVTAVISAATKITKIEFPFDINNPPQEITFTPTETTITISELKEGQQVFLTSSENIANKTKINSVTSIEVMPQ